jgi:transglutaminase-like putative cysteine protease
VDAFGNCIEQFEIHDRLQRLLISAISTVTIKVSNPANSVLSRSSAEDEPGRDDLADFRSPTHLVPVSRNFADYTKVVFAPGKPVVEAAGELTRYIHADMGYSPGSTDIRTGADQVLISRQGVCQDFTHLALACLRSHGLAARYVSGYVHSAAFRGKSHRIASDASHAWFSVFDPQHGWVDFDPTNGRSVDHHYITVAWGRDYDDVCPLTGTFQGEASHSLKVSVDVKKLDPD